MRVKIRIRQFLNRLGLWESINILRLIPEVLNWLISGCRGVAPHTIKVIIIKAYLKQFSIDNFIETGTCLGDTLGYIAKLGIRCASVELSQELYKAACRRFKRYENVKLVQGDSAQKLPLLLEEIKTPALFWLDGHYSSGITACAEIHTPISFELQAIIRHPIKKHVVLIDDARCFDGKNGYPYLDDLLHSIREEGSYNYEVSLDIIRLVPNII